jgi:hypothetical protein
LTSMKFICQGTPAGASGWLRSIGSPEEAIQRDAA